jgi:glycosyltransferase involved in cell wall biosynthesis
MSPKTTTYLLGQSLLGNLFRRSFSRSRELVVLDDLFPHRLSAFRVTEYNELLRHFRNAAVYSSGETFPALGEKRDFAAVHAEYGAVYPDLGGKIFRFKPRRKVAARLAYLMFLNNADRFLDYLQACKLPFVLELYPGGGFHLEDAESDRKLRRVLSSPLLQRVIVTQKITRDYLTGTMGFPADRLDFIYGGVFLHAELASEGLPRRRYGLEKETLDVCFVANKYVPQGRDKGYDVFIQTASLLARSYPCIRFHVVGPFGPEDFELGGAADRITFYGSRTTDFFPTFYSGMDLILSPNVPFVLRPGAFDGFPTGACIEAVLCGVALFCCDELKLNPFTDGEELVVVPHDPVQIARIIGRYCEDFHVLHRVAEAGQLQARRLFSRECQIEPRLKVLETAMENAGWA